MRGSFQRMTKSVVKSLSFWVVGRKVGYLGNKFTAS